MQLSEQHSEVYFIKRVFEKTLLSGNCLGWKLSANSKLFNFLKTKCLDFWIFLASHLPLVVVGQ